MLSLFSIERNSSKSKNKSTVIVDSPNFGKIERSVRSDSNGDRGNSQLVSNSMDSATQSLWPSKVGRTMLFSKHTGDCECCIRPLPMQQSIDEMDWERGVWGLSNSGKLDRVERLLISGVDPNVRDTNGYCALHYAARAGHYEICQMLLFAGAHVDCSTLAGGATPLMRSALQGHLEVCRLLISHRASVTASDSDEQTPLHKAAAGGSAAVICLLLEATAAPYIYAHDARGATPLDLARAAGGAAAEALVSRTQNASWTGQKLAHPEMLRVAEADEVS